MKMHFITSYCPNSKSKLHRTRKFCRTYELQCTHCFFRAKTEAYSDFEKLMTVIGNVALCKTKRVKRDTQNWFDGQVLEQLSLGDKLLKTLKRARLHIDNLKN